METNGPKARVKSWSRPGSAQGGSISSTCGRATRAAWPRRALPVRTPGRAPPRSAGSIARPMRSPRGLSFAPALSRLPAAAGPSWRRRARSPRSHRARLRYLPTRRVKTPSAAKKLCPESGPTETRPRAALSPTRPQHEAGMRIEPPPSLPWAIGTMPAATAAAEPPLEPPGVRSSPHGLRVGPNRRVSVVGRIAISGSAVLPTITNPARRSRRTRKESRVGDVVTEQVAADGQRHTRDRPVVLDRDRDSGEGPPSPRAISSASRIAESYAIWVKALMVDWRASMRCSDAATSSRALNSPERTMDASSWPGETAAPRPP